MREAKRIRMLEVSSGKDSDRGGLDCKTLLREMHLHKTNNLNRLYERGNVLFAEGEESCGVYILRSGTVSLSLSSADGRVLVLRVAQAGDLLGASSVIRNSSYFMTSTTLEPVCAAFITTKDFFGLIDQSQQAASAVLSIVSQELEYLGERAKSLLLANTASAKLARLLLDWSCESDTLHVGFVRIDKRFTHEQIAQMICSSRETVSRLFATLRRKQILQITSNGILVQDRIALENLALSADENVLRAPSNVRCL